MPGRVALGREARIEGEDHLDADQGPCRPGDADEGRMLRVLLTKPGPDVPWTESIQDPEEAQGEQRDP